jgi:hypothetical protein
MGMERGRGGSTSINCRAFSMADSCRTWFMSWVFGSEEADMEEAKASMV